MRSAGGDRRERLPLRRRRLVGLVVAPADGGAVGAERAGVQPAGAHRDALYGRAVRRKRRRRARRRPERPSPAALRCAESGVGRQNRDRGRSGGGLLEYDDLSGIVEPAQSRPPAFAGEVCGLVDARYDLLADAPRSGPERRPRERRRRSRRGSGRGGDGRRRRRCGRNWGRSGRRNRRDGSRRERWRRRCAGRRSRRRLRPASGERRKRGDDEDERGEAEHIPRV